MQPGLSDRCARCSIEYKHHHHGRCPHGATRYASFLPMPAVKPDAIVQVGDAKGKAQ